MGFSIRCTLTPDLRKIGKQVRVVGTTLGLEWFGSNRTKAKRLEKQAAKIIFSIGFLDQLRNVSQVEQKRFAELCGTIQLNKNWEVEFFPEVDAELQHDETTGDEETPPQCLSVLLDDTSFLDIQLANGGNSLVLQLPEAPENCFHAEITAVVEVDGATENEANQGDRLDIAVTGPIARVFIDSDFSLGRSTQKFILRADDNSYSQARYATDVQTNAEQGVELIFDRLPKGKTFTLSSHYAKTTEYSYFKNIPYTALVKAVNPAPMGNIKRLNEPEWHDLADEIFEFLFEKEEESVEDDEFEIETKDILEEWHEPFEV